MFTFRIFLAVSFIFGIVSASISFFQVKFNIFDAEKHAYESKVLASVNNIQEYFATRYMYMTAPDYEPDYAKFFHVTTELKDFLVDGSDWMKMVAKTITNKYEFGAAMSTLNLIKLKKDTIINRMTDLNNKSLSDQQRKQSALLIQDEFNGVIQDILSTKELMIKYPLLAAPAIIELALSIATFDEISSVLNINKKHQLPCQIRDILLQCRSSAVDFRLNKLGAELYGMESESDLRLPSEQLARIRTAPFNPISYTKHCCSLECEKGCKPNTSTYKAICVKDEYGADEYYALDYNNSACLEGYAGLVRLRVENAFPVRLLTRLCGKQ